MMANLKLEFCEPGPNNAGATFSILRPKRLVGIEGSGTAAESRPRSDRKPRAKYKRRGL